MREGQGGPEMSSPEPIISPSQEAVFSIHCKVCGKQSEIQFTELKKTSLVWRCYVRNEEKIRSSFWQGWVESVITFDTFDKLEASCENCGHLQTIGYTRTGSKRFLERHEHMPGDMHTIWEKELP